MLRREGLPGKGSRSACVRTSACAAHAEKLPEMRLSFYTLLGVFAAAVHSSTAAALPCRLLAVKLHDACASNSCAPGIAQENNFKAVLESIRDLLNEHMDAMPVWLHQLFLGYGLPDSAHYSHMPNLLTDIDFKDTFLDAQHLRASFPGVLTTLTSLQHAVSNLPACHQA